MIFDKRLKNLTGLRFGKLIVLGYDCKTKDKHYWLCVCNCGKEKSVEGGSLKSGNTSSCGCLQRERTSELRLNLAGKKFGKLEVLEYIGYDKEYKSRNRNHKWRCKCDCGATCDILSACLQSGTTQSCGCLHKERTSKARRIDLTGRKVGKLSVVKFSHTDDKGQTFWLCICECGKEKVINSASLRRGKSKSCGCRQGNFVHGMTGKPGYKAFYLRDPVKKLKHSIGTAVRTALKRRNCTKNGGRTFDYLPYTPQELKEHLELQFEPWMNWENYGGSNDSPNKTWHIDHIIPQSSFKFTSLNDPEFTECWSLSNLRPLEKIANMQKGSD